GSTGREPGTSPSAAGPPGGAAATSATGSPGGRQAKAASPFGPTAAALPIATGWRLCGGANSPAAFPTAHLSVSSWGAWPYRTAATRTRPVGPPTTEILATRSPALGHTGWAAPKSPPGGATA